MHGFSIFLEHQIDFVTLQQLLEEIFPELRFLEWDINNDRINGIRNYEVKKDEILLELRDMQAPFRTIVEFYRFPGEEGTSHLNLFIAEQLSKTLNCKTAIDGYSYNDLDQLPFYSLMISKDKAYLIHDCFYNLEDEPTKEQTTIKIIQEVDINEYRQNFNTRAEKIG